NDKIWGFARGGKSISLYWYHRVSSRDALVQRSGVLMADEEVTVIGLDKLQKNMEEMSLKVAKKGIDKALRAGAEPIYQGMVNGAPRYAGSADYPPIGWLAEHFGTKLKRGAELSGTAFIGPQGKIDYPAYASGAFDIVRNAKGKAVKVGRIAVATVARFFEFGTSKMTK